MTALTDELLRRRLADRGAQAPAISLTAVARSVASQPRRRVAGAAARAAFVGPIAAVLVIAVAVAGGLLARGSTPPTAAHGSGSPAPGSTRASSGAVAGSPSPSGPADVVAWTSLTWEKVAAAPFASDGTLITDAIAVGDGFVAVGTTQTGKTVTGHVWRSPDGRTWERVADPGIASLAPSRIFVVGDTLVILGSPATTDVTRADPVELWHSTDGEAWTRGPDLPASAGPDFAAGGPGGILVAAGTDTWLLGPDLAGWNRTATWPTGTLLGTPAWAAGRWIQPGTTGVEANGEPSRAAIWTSRDGRTWDRATVDQPEGGMFRVLAAESGMVGIGTDSEVCLQCRGLGLRSTVAWGSADGATWRRSGWVERGLSIEGFGVTSVPTATFGGDGHRVVVIGQSTTFAGSGVAIQTTLDGMSWTPVTAQGGQPDGSALSGTMVVGRNGVALLQGGAGTGSDRTPNIWWAAASDGPSPGPEPSAPASPVVTGCDTLGFGEVRCRAVVARALEMAGNPDGVVSIAIERSVGADVSLGSHPIATVGLTLGDGTSKVVEIRCLNLGSASDRVCSDDPQIVIAGGVSHDAPCGATPGDESHPCATEPPRPRPAVVARSTPLILRTFDVLLDHVGHYEVLVGSASLPDGLLGERSGTLADSRPTTWWIDDGVQIVVRPGDPCIGARCQTIDNVYHEPFDGPQPVNVYLVFDVVELDTPGAILEVGNLVVR